MKKAKKILVGTGDINKIIPIGNHLLIELDGVDAEILNDPKIIEETLITVAEQAGATVLNSFIHTFEPQGVTGVVAVSESHLSTHDWPEHNYATVDIFFCGDKVNLSVAKKIIEARLKPQSVRALIIIRGLLKKFVNT